MTNHDLNWLSSQQPQPVGGRDQDAHDRALLALVRHTADRSARRGLGLRGPLRQTTVRPTRPGLGLRGPLRSQTFVLAAAAGLTAVAAAVVVSIGGTGGGAQAGHDTAGPQAAVQHHTRVQQHTPVQHRTAVHHRAAGSRSPLVRLADYVSTSPAPAGNATVVARTTHTDGRSVTVYDLYADDGQYFFSPQASGLKAQVDAHHNLAGGLFAREIAAAKLAATGNVQTAARDMADAPDPGHVISRRASAQLATIRAKLKAAGSKLAGLYAPGVRFDDWVWDDSLDALTAGAGNPQVRVGVLRILATLPGVTVDHGTSGGRPTLVLTAGAHEFGSGYSEQLTILADSGVPVQFVGGSSGGTRATTVDYRVSRVTFAGLSSRVGNGA